MAALASHEVDGSLEGDGAAVQYRHVTGTCTGRRVWYVTMPPPLQPQRLAPAREHLDAVAGSRQRQPPAPCTHGKVTARRVVEQGHGVGAHVPCRMIEARRTWWGVRC